MLGVLLYGHRASTSPNYFWIIICNYFGWWVAVVLGWAVSAGLKLVGLVVANGVVL